MIINADLRVVPEACYDPDPPDSRRRCVVSRCSILATRHAIMTLMQMRASVSSICMWLFIHGYGLCYCYQVVFIHHC